MGRIQSMRCIIINNTNEFQRQDRPMIRITLFSIFIGNKCYSRVGHIQPVFKTVTLQTEPLRQRSWLD